MADVSEQEGEEITYSMTFKVRGSDPGIPWAVRKRAITPKLASNPCLESLGVSIKGSKVNVKVRVTEKGMQEYGPDKLDELIEKFGEGIKGFQQGKGRVPVSGFGYQRLENNNGSFIADDKRSEQGPNKTGEAGDKITSELTSPIESAKVEVSDSHELMDQFFQEFDKLEKANEKLADENKRLEHERDQAVRVQRGQQERIEELIQQRDKRWKNFHEDCISKVASVMLPAEDIEIMLADEELYRDNIEDNALMRRVRELDLLDPGFGMEDISRFINTLDEENVSDKLREIYEQKHDNATEDYSQAKEALKTFNATKEALEKLPGSRGLQGVEHDIKEAEKKIKKYEDGRDTFMNKAKELIEDCSLFIDRQDEISSRAKDISKVMGGGSFPIYILKQEDENAYFVNIYLPFDSGNSDLTLHNTLLENIFSEKVRGKIKEEDFDKLTPLFHEEGILYYILELGKEDYNHKKVLSIVDEIEHSIHEGYNELILDRLGVYLDVIRRSEIKAVYDIIPKKKAEPVRVESKEDSELEERVAEAPHDHVEEGTKCYLDPFYKDLSPRQKGQERFERVATYIQYMFETSASPLSTYKIEQELINSYDEKISVPTINRTILELREAGRLIEAGKDGRKALYDLKPEDKEKVKELRSADKSIPIEKVVADTHSAEVESKEPKCLLPPLYEGVEVLRADEKIYSHIQYMLENAEEPLSSTEIKKEIEKKFGIEVSKPSKLLAPLIESGKIKLEGQRMHARYSIAPEYQKILDDLRGKDKGKTKELELEQAVSDVSSAEAEPECLLPPLYKKLKHIDDEAKAKMDQIQYVLENAEEPLQISQIREEMQRVFGGNFYISSELSRLVESNRLVQNGEGRTAKYSLKESTKKELITLRRERGSAAAESLEKTVSTGKTKETQSEEPGCLLPPLYEGLTTRGLVRKRLDYIQFVLENAEEPLVSGEITKEIKKLFGIELSKDQFYTTIKKLKDAGRISVYQISDHLAQYSLKTKDRKKLDSLRSTEEGGLEQIAAKQAPALGKSGLPLLNNDLIYEGLKVTDSVKEKMHYIQAVLEQAGDEELLPRKEILKRMKAMGVKVKESQLKNCLHQLYVNKRVYRKGIKAGSKYRLLKSIDQNGQKT